MATQPSDGNASDLPSYLLHEVPTVGLDVQSLRFFADGMFRGSNLNLRDRQFRDGHRSALIRIAIRGARRR